MKMPMMLGPLLLTALSFAPAGGAAEVDWKPTFDDEPVTADEAAQVSAAVPTAALADPAAPRRVLVVSSTSGFRHSSIPIGKLAVETMGEKTGAFETVISDDPANFEPEVLKTFDAVVLLNAGNNFFMPTVSNKLSLRDQFTDEQWAQLEARHQRLVGNLIDYVEAGGGLVGIHAATTACQGHPNLGRTLGATFWFHPWSAKQQVMLVVEDPEHALIRPVFGDTRELSLIEELYEFREEPFPRDRLRVLLNIDPDRSERATKWPRQRADDDYPVAWVQAVGEGRVFYTSLGHNHDLYWNPLILNHYLAGIQFATGDLKADTTPSAKVVMPGVER